MAVTRLERKAAKNKSRAKLRVRTIKRHQNRNYIASPHREVSGIVLEGDALSVAQAIDNAPAPKASAAKAAPKAETEKPAEATPVVEKAPKATPAAEKAPKATKVKADKLTKIEGIGPKIAQVLSENGVASFAALAGSTPEAIREILDNAEGNFKAHDPGTWPAQSQMAADGDWDALKTWQDEHDGGKA